VRVETCCCSCSSTMMPNSETTSNPIRAARMSKRLTQAGAAAALGYSASYYAMMEREPRLISERMATRLARVLGVSIKDLGLVHLEPQPAVPVE